ncbi:MAG TPA: YgiQ family radical SAM protein [Bacteroidales bacterium]|nr:YgiQ family radical SAM protein [Bacteroidales bacterium]HPS17029.1 YgiQ family radical SAM protein [Bacteroidales bacterium]
MSNSKLSESAWLPISKKEIEARGWEQPDIIIVSGDAYVDHPSFGHAVIARILEKDGFKVAILPQPNWRDDLRDFKKLGTPKLFFGVTAGCMDSMINHYTANKRLRSDDAYTPGGQAGFRPDYASIVYTKILKKLFPEIPVILGGVEASLRRFTHYDYWSDSLKPSILFESGADMLVYGMGEMAIRKIAAQLSEGKKINELKNIEQTAYIDNTKLVIPDAIELSSYEKCLKDKIAYAKNFVQIEIESNSLKAKTIIQQHGEKWLVVNTPFPPLSSSQIDASFDLPFTRMPHPRYESRGQIPAYEMIKFSVNIHRGCFGGCSFCTISAHQGKFVSSRSEKSILKEVETITKQNDFKGHITDLGGPSANMYQMQGKDLKLCETCKRYSCIYPSVCKNLDINHKPILDIYNKVSKIQGIKKVTIGSGIRYDMLQTNDSKVDKENHLSEYAKQVICEHVSGRLKVAPEHTSDEVLKMMRKPSFDSFRKFNSTFNKICREEKLNQQLIPYFISSHPGCKLAQMAELAAETKNMGFHLEQVQDFTPTPMTLSTEIFYTGIDPYSLKHVYVAHSSKDKHEQQKFFFWYKKENVNWIKDTLLKLHREDLLPKLIKDYKENKKDFRQEKKQNKRFGRR